MAFEGQDPGSCTDVNDSGNITALAQILVQIQVWFKKFRNSVHFTYFDGIL